MKVPQAWAKSGPVSLTAFKIDAGISPEAKLTRPLNVEARGSQIIEQPESKTEVTAEGDVARWWVEMSPESKREYVAEHPNSKYADMHRKETGEEPAPAPKAEEHKPAGPAKEQPAPMAKKPAPQVQKPHGPGHKGHAPAPAPKKPSLPSEHKPADSSHDKVGTPDKESTLKMLANPEYAPASPKRKAIVGFLRKKTSHIVSHLKHDVKEWKTAGIAMKKLATGKPLEHADKHAMGAVAADLAAVTASLMLTGGAAHGIIAFMHHFGAHLAQEALLKAAVKGAAGSAVHHASVRVLTTASDEDQMMQAAIKYMMDALENGDLTEMIQRFEAEAKSEGKGPEAQKEVKQASTLTAGTQVEAKLDMSEATLGKGKCPDCKSPMIIAHIDGENGPPCYACQACRVSLPLPDNHEYFTNGQEKEEGRSLVG
jgi:hypothetical protein